MGIESTQYIKKEEIIDRLTKIIHYINQRDFVSLKELFEHNCYEDEKIEMTYIDYYNNVWDRFIEKLEPYEKNNSKLKTAFFLSNEENLKKFFNEILDNKSLEELMDMPGVRYSMFENYLIED